MAAPKHAPRGVRAVLEALRLPDSSLELSEAEWREALAYCDEARLTLALGAVCGDRAPDWVRQRLGENLAANQERRSRLWLEYEELAQALRAARVDFVVLKGFTHCPDFVPDLKLRVQYDLDLYCLPETVQRAYAAASALGYEPIRGFEQFPLDHLPVMIRKTGWKWRGDYFDPDFPPSLELHFRLWNPGIERFGPAGLEAFWNRRVSRELDGHRFTTLNRADALAYACLHWLRHLFRGHLRAYQIFEVARFLQGCAEDDEFWKEWQRTHEPSLRRLEAICFAWAREWSGCRLSPAALEEVEALPVRLRRWIEEYSYAPIDALWVPNKDELWLHLSLLESPRDRAAVLLRRLAPMRLSGPVEAVHVPADRKTWTQRIQARLRYGAFLARRVLWHARTLPPLFIAGLRWWRSPR
ncbi:MAG: nucleotidyltransferase family protein [Acidobacteriota bacterium]|nr:nucleotidyltransferase family protein [Acidobacteriota bacterium]